jgi:beta-galactosidase beta subunit
MRVIDRLLKYLAYKRITAYSFERTCQVANGYLKKQQKGKGTVGSDILERIHRNYFDLNLVWLISGRDEMLVEPGENKEVKNQLQEEKHYYTKDEIIQFLSERISLLERSLADKEKIIDMLEAKAGKRKHKEAGG